jgi:hypothetical protein
MRDYVDACGNGSMNQQQTDNAAAQYGYRIALLRSRLKESVHGYGKGLDRRRILVGDRIGKRPDKVRRGSGILGETPGQIHAHAPLLRTNSAASRETEATGTAGIIGFHEPALSRLEFLHTVSNSGYASDDLVSEYKGIGHDTVSEIKGDVRPADAGAFGPEYDFSLRRARSLNLLYRYFFWSMQQRSFHSSLRIRCIHYSSPVSILNLVPSSTTKIMGGKSEPC